ncbi:hypothetical protein BDZ90DRAFT_135314 [Jaminaea rosea]|uniref:Uncharacterized protein n=1 Tax=Jaminaea rosea TaxID=1569628 RepID=A0A316UYI1_9BASI|nr:hypothetical protein BDZ90DRAFT_135314 [Jaminaea rosea]PWN28963.1 hypothetical protein BDZ90DRAFT_135314 [Jaminaea rosea]
MLTMLCYFILSTCSYNTSTSSRCHRASMSADCSYLPASIRNFDRLDAAHRSCGPRHTAKPPALHRRLMAAAMDAMLVVRSPALPRRPLQRLAAAACWLLLVLRGCNLPGPLTSRHSLAPPRPALRLNAKLRRSPPPHLAGLAHLDLKLAPTQPSLACVARVLALVSAGSPFDDTFSPFVLSSSSSRILTSSLAVGGSAG